MLIFAVLGIGLVLAALAWQAQSPQPVRIPVAIPSAPATEQEQHAAAQVVPPPATPPAASTVTPVTAELPVKPPAREPGTIWIDVPEQCELGKSYVLDAIVETGGDFLAAYGTDLRWDPQLLSVDTVGSPSGGAMEAPFVVDLQQAQGRLRFNGLNLKPVATGSVKVATLHVTITGRPPTGGSIRIEGYTPNANHVVAVYGSDGVTPVTLPDARVATARLRVE